MRTAIGIVLVASWCAATAGLTEVAHAAHVQCGAVILEDTTLDSDLIDCPTFGVEIARDAVTLDLNGHTIDGNAQSDSGRDDGVRAFGRHGITVGNGTITEFTDSGVDLTNVTDSTIRDLTLRATLSDFRDSVGVRLSSLSARNLVSGNTITGNFSSVGISVFGFGHPHPPLEENRIEGNTIVGSARAIWITASDANVVAHNHISGPQLDGIEVFSQANANRIEENVIRGVAGGEGISFVESDRNVVRRNAVFDGGGHGIDVQFRSHQTVVDGNRLRGNTGDGVLVRETSLQALVRRNHADRNGDDGIDVDSASTTVTANRAMRNADLGIEAVPGTVDGGRNQARHNGNPEECTGIACR